MCKKGNIKINSFVKRSYLSLVVYLFVFSALLVSIAYSGDFKLIKVNSHYEPELKNDDEPAITLPGTNIKAGLYRYYFDDGSSTGKIGFLIDKERFFFLESRRQGKEQGTIWQYGLAGDVTYGIYKNYFLLEASAGGTTRNSILFLFRYDKNGVQFLDQIERTYFDFISAGKQTEDNDNPWEQGGPVWMDIKDTDGDGRPEIKLIISSSFKFRPYFNLYLEIRGDRLKVDFNPNLYKPLFEQERHKFQKTKKISDQYYIYGFLAKELSLDKIKKRTLQADRETLISSLIQDILKLDEVFHEGLQDENFILKQYNLKRR